MRARMGAIVSHSVSAWWDFIRRHPLLLDVPLRFVTAREYVRFFEWPPCCLPSVRRGPAHSRCAVHSLDSPIGCEHFTRYYPLKAPVLILSTTWFDIQKFCLVPTQRIYVFLHGFQNKQRLFPYIALTDWIL